MKRPALQNKHVLVYEWLFGSEKFSGLSRNGSLDWHDMRTNSFPSREEPALSQVQLGNDAICFNGPFAVERSRGTKMELEGFSVQSLLYG